MTFIILKYLFKNKYKNYTNEVIIKYLHLKIFPTYINFDLIEKNLVLKFKFFITQ